MAHLSTLISFRHFFLVFLILGFNQLNYGQVKSSCDIPPELELNYSEDVKEMALQRIYQQNSTYKDSIEIPQIYQDSIWQGLASIYNAFGIPERDSVFDIHCIHWDVPWYLRHGVYIGITEDCPWYENWANLNILTGVSELDSLITKYGIELDYFGTNIHYGEFSINQDLNLTALCELIDAFSYIEYADPISIDGDGNQIHYQVNDDGSTIGFKIAYDDCPSGCQSHWTYHFQVYQDCSVDYLGYTHAEENGVWSIIPQPSYCNITNTQELIENEEIIEIYPNPAHENFSILSDNNHDFTVEIYSLTGKMIKSEITRNSKIDITDLKTGVYLLKIKPQNKSPKTLKLFKTQH